MAWFPWLCQILCLFFLSLNFEASFSSSLSPSSPPNHCSNIESNALLQFKSTFSINKYASQYCVDRNTKSYPKANSWKEGTDCCKWDGVACDSATGFVIGLDLSCSWLDGTITSNSSLFHLRHLQWLNLAYNDFKMSNISPEFGGFASLIRLNLSYSRFSGAIPYNISQLSKLVSVDLTDYYLGAIKIEEHTFGGLVQNLTKVRFLVLDGVDMSAVDPGSFENLSLTYLSLDNCGLRGKFPQNIFHLPNLKLLNLPGNFKLSSYLPKTDWSSPLEYLSLSYTSFSGELPDSIGNLKSLKYLELALSNFSGSLPRSLGNLSQLTVLDLSYNNFWGEISFSLAKLTKLEIFDLSFNKIVGSIPNQVSLFHKLSSIDLSNNLLNGTLSTWLFNLSTLELLFLQNNQLSGQINEFQQKSLSRIHLGNNKLQGPIPNSIFELVRLFDLSLPFNNLSGIIEFNTILKQQNLRYLDLSGNQYLSLKYSNTNVNYTFPIPFYLSLSSCKIGDFPNFLRALTNLQQLDLSDNDIHGKVPEWFWEVGRNSLTHLNLSSNFLTSFEEIPWNKIEVLDLHSNLLQGRLPILPSTIAFFSFSNNSLSGPISSQIICNASSLRLLDLSHNNLSGILPQCLLNFSESLTVLNLQRNKFHGMIPSPVASNSCGLKFINFNGNQFEGRLPSAMASCRDLEVLNFGNNNINDTFPPWLESLPELQVLVLRSNQFHGFIDGCKSDDHCFSNLQILDLSNNDFNGPLPSKYIENLQSLKIHQNFKSKIILI